MAPSVQRRKVWLTPSSGMPYSNAAKTRNPLKFAGMPQTNETISAASGPKFTILWEHVEEILLLNKFFAIVDVCLSCEDIARQIVRWSPDGNFLHPVFSASRMRHISDLYSKFALRSHLCGSMADIRSATAEIRRGKKKKDRRNHRAKI